MEETLSLGRARSRRAIDYSIQTDPLERLRILTTAVERAFVAMPNVEKSTSAALQRISPALKAMVLEEERGDEGVTIDLLMGLKHRERAEPLGNALQQLRAMVEYPSWL